MNKKEKNQKEFLNASLPVEITSKVKAIAERTRRTKSQVVLILLEYALDRMEVT